MTYQPATHQITFVLPLYFWKAEIVITGQASKSEYYTVPVSSGDKPRRVVSTEMLGKGHWRALLHWSDGRSQYCSEKMIKVL